MRAALASAQGRGPSSAARRAAAWRATAIGWVAFAGAYGLALLVLVT